jgi:hypothetical protein
MTVEDLIADYRAGVYTRGEVISKLIEMIEPSNLDSLMKEIPEEFATRLKQWAYEVDPLSPNVVFFNISSEAAEKIKKHNRVVVPLIRNWFASHENTTEQGPTAQDKRNS